MVLAPSISASFTTLLPSPLSRDRVFLGFTKPISLVHSAPSAYHSADITLSRRQKLNSAITAAKKKKNTTKKKQIFSNNSVAEEDVLDEDAFEALFKQLEEDLKNDDISLDNDISDDDITEEEFAQFERELKELLGDDDIIEMEAASGDNEEGDEDDDDSGEDEDDEIERPVELKRWQLRRLASALKTGRRKTSIKNLAAELGLERSIVLELLRDPPSHLLMMCATMPDELEPREIVTPSQIVEVASEKTKEDAAEPETKEKLPLHVMQQKWSAQKRLKKVQAQTMEDVYRRTKRPTNAMISSIVQVTSLPRKRIVKWFEDKRAEEGVPDQRTRYQRPDPEAEAETEAISSP